MTLLFWPALLAALGLLVAPAALGFGAVALRRIAAVAPSDPREPYGKPYARTGEAARAALLIALVALAFLAAAQSDAIRTAGDVLGFAICCAIALLGVAALV